MQDLCRGGARYFANIAQRSCGGSKDLGLKIGGKGGGVAPPPPRSAPDQYVIFSGTDTDPTL